MTSMHDIQHVLRNFTQAWDQHDCEELASLWLDDGVLDHPWGWRAVGRDAVRDLLAKEHGSNMAESTLHMLDVTVDHVRADTAIVNVNGILHNVRAPHGRLYDLTHRLSAMMTRGREGEWRIQTMTAWPNERRE